MFSLWYKVETDFRLAASVVITFNRSGNHKPINKYFKTRLLALINIFNEIITGQVEDYNMAVGLCCRLYKVL